MAYSFALNLEEEKQGNDKLHFLNRYEDSIIKDLPEDSVTISISDDGYGILADIQKDIFTPFYTTKMTKTNTSPGLSICQYIVENH